MRRRFKDVKETKRVEKKLPMFPEFLSEVKLPDEIVDSDGADDLPDEIDFGFFEKLIEDGVKPDTNVDLHHDFELPN